MLKRSFVLSTVFAAAIAVTIPLMGGAGTVVAASDGSATSYDIASTATPVPQSTALSPKAVEAAAAQAAATAKATAADTTATTTAKTTTAVVSAKVSATAVSATVPTDDATTTASAAPSSQAVARGASSSASAAPHVVAHAATTATPKPAVAAAPKSCPSAVGGSPSTVPGNVTSDGLQGTTNADLASFAIEYDALRVANCLTPIPLANIRYDSCLQARMFWIAEDPSTNPASAWGHDLPRSDGAPIVGCDGDIAGGIGDTGTTAAQKWWESPDHQLSLFQPKWTGSFANVCIGFAISHGGIPNDPAALSRESARWETCSSFGS